MYVDGNPLFGIDPFGLVNQSWKKRGRNPANAGKGTIFGPVCGSGSSARYIPDGFAKKACEAHDKCYGTCGKSKEFCDMMFLIDSNNPWYYEMVDLFGDAAYEDAQKEACNEKGCGNK